MKQVIPPLWTLALAFGVLLSAGGALWAGSDQPRSPDGGPATIEVDDLYARTASAVVGITCRQGRRNVYFGTGAVIDPSGLVLTSVTVVPKGAREIRVYFEGGRTGNAWPERNHDRSRIGSGRHLLLQHKDTRHLWSLFDLF